MERDFWKESWEEVTVAGKTIGKQKVWFNSDYNVYKINPLDFYYSK
jgi:hypothetical protein